uniref:Uncharacterized protein n=1 Tax=Anguilla anguilla TaxID=7936 RepID=A0A0E9P6T2_ANGAN
MLKCLETSQWHEHYSRARPFLNMLLSPRVMRTSIRIGFQM